MSAPHSWLLPVPRYQQPAHSVLRISTRTNTAGLGKAAGWELALMSAIQAWHEPAAVDEAVAGSPGRLPVRQTLAAYATSKLPIRTMATTMPASDREQKRMSWPSTARRANT